MSPLTDELDPQTIQNLAHARRLSVDDDFSPSFSSLGELLNARVQETPDKNFLTFYDDAGNRCAYTYREFASAAHHVAALMHGPLGLRPGDRIATLLVNDPRTVLIYFGAWLLGLCVVPLNCGEDDDRIRFMVNNAAVKAVFVMADQAERWESLWAEAPSVTGTVDVGGRLNDSFFDFDAWMAPAPPSSGTPPPSERERGQGQGAVWASHKAESDTNSSPRHANPAMTPSHWPLSLSALRVASAEGGGVPDEGGAGAACLIVYTSGTTGAPKGVVLEQGNLLADAQSIAAWHGFGPEDRALNVLPIHHVNGIVVTLITPLFSGGSVVLSRKFRAQTFWQTLAEEACTWTSVVPTILAFLCERRDDLVQYDLSHFRHIICGAGPLTTELAARFAACYPIRVVHGYGLSETTCYSCFLPVDLSDADYHYWMTGCGFPSIGCPLPVNEMAIHDSEGRALPPGERGEIVIRGFNVMRGYFQRPDANRDTFAHGWFRSGDEGFSQIGSDGRAYFFITGRLKELIIRGGVNYSPFDIDEVLGAIPGVQAAMAVGFENRFYGEEIGAYVQLTPGTALTADEILCACRQRLSFAKSPKVVVFGDTFPVTSTGKYQRLKLRPLFAAWRDAEFRERK